MQRGVLTRDDVERFEGEMGKLIVVKRALELALINPAIRDEQKGPTAGPSCSANGR